VYFLSLLWVTLIWNAGKGKGVPRLNYGRAQVK